MIILAASVVITLSNTGVINRASEAVDATNQSQVQDLAALIWADAFMDNLRGEDLVSEVTTKLEEQGVTAANWDITVTDTGVTVSIKNSTTTLGELIKNPVTDYGKLVDYEANGVKEWQVFYEDEANGYVFLIAKDNVGATSFDMSLTSITSEQETLYSIFKLGQEGYTLDLDRYNNQAVAELIVNYGAYANMTDYGSYVIGAIGGPTIELLAAGYNAKYGEEKIIPVVDTSYYDYEGEKNDGIPMYDGASGYFINKKGQSGLSALVKDGIYFNIPNNSYSDYWLASPSGGADADVGWRFVIIAYSNKVGTQLSYCFPGNACGVRPVVCLKSSIPAIETADGYSLVK
jgi:hypothetical protein